ncbi:TPA_asm: hypothetical protein GIH01_14410 [Listeria monocytogenes]|nr:hypothetical protein [Listeria monocytogenes]
MVKKTEKKQLKGSHQAEPDAVKFERMEDWFQGFTVDQYVHLKDSGMKDSDLVDLLDIPVGVPSAYGKFVSIRITNSRNINV